MALLVYPNAAALFVAETLKAVYDGGTLHLLKDVVHPSTATTLAECEAAEADASGYEPADLENWSEVYLSESGSGSSLRTLEKQFRWVAPVSGDPVGNTIQGYYIKTADNLLLLVGDLDTPQTLTKAGDSIFIDVAVTYCST